MENNLQDRIIAYFSMEIAIESGAQTYSGGLGILAGDTIRSAADLALPMVAMTLLHRKGYFYQRLTIDGWQTEEPALWPVQDYLREVKKGVSVKIEGRTVHLRAWQFDVKGVGGYEVPVYFLDANLPSNSEWDRTLTDYLYGGDPHYRLCQEVILGIGGVKMLRALGYERLERYHMNEGHSSLLALELLEEEMKATGKKEIDQEAVDRVRKKCVFTTHTPVPAGQDQFPMDLADRILGHHKAFEKKEHFCYDGILNMTFLALNLSHYVNGVAKKHGEVSQHMFAHYKIDSITNGVHAATWTSKPFQALFDRHIPGWREDNSDLRYALSIPKDEVWEAHKKAKKLLIEEVNHQTNAGMDADILTLGFARRAAAYKRPDLIFADVERLKQMNRKTGPLQIIFSGKAHPNDGAGKDLIKRIFQMKELLRNDIRISYLENYDLRLGQMITSGVDIWLNTPQPPMEASGTSGMKAALNGVPSFSILDGWWIEGHIESITGWSIGTNGGSVERQDSRSEDASSFYKKLEEEIIPLFYKNRNRYIEIMRHCIAINGSFFNTQRMLQQYVTKAYFV